MKTPERQRRYRRRKGRPSALHIDETFMKTVNHDTVSWYSKYIDTNIEYVENNALDKNR